jgi:hypothetical protein
MRDQRYNPQKTPFPPLPLRFKVSGFGFGFGFDFAFGCGSAAQRVKRVKYSMRIR